MRPAPKRSRSVRSPWTMRARRPSGAVIPIRFRSATARADAPNRASTVVGQYKRRLAKRIKHLSNGRALDKARLAVEVALFARNCDISEEITRMRSHMKNMRTTLGSKREAGKRIDFIAQELYREANTISAKANDAVVSEAIIRVKGEIEKIREQAQNIE